MVIGRIVIINDQVVADGVTHKLVQLPNGVCYGCAFDTDDDEICCENVPEYIKEMCISTGSVWIKE